MQSLHDELHNYMVQLPGLKSQGLNLAHENDRKNKAKALLVELSA